MNGGAENCEDMRRRFGEGGLLLDSCCGKKTQRHTTSLGTRSIVMTVGDYKNKKGRAAVKRKIEEGTLRHGEGTGRHVDDMGCHFPPKR